MSNAEQTSNTTANIEDVEMTNEMKNEPIGTPAPESKWGWKTWTGIGVAAVAALGLGYWGYRELSAGSESAVDIG